MMPRQAAFRNLGKPSTHGARGGSTKMGKRFVREGAAFPLETTNDGDSLWHLSRQTTCAMSATGWATFVKDERACKFLMVLTNAELRALYTRLWYLEKCGKLKRIK